MNTLASIKWINVLWETDNIDFLPPNFVFLVTDRSRKTGKFNVNNHYGCEAIGVLESKQCAF